MDTSDTLNYELLGLRAVRAFHEALTNLSEEKKPLQSVCRAVTQVFEHAHAAIFSVDDENVTFEYRTSYPADRRKYEISISAFNPDEESPLAQLLAGDVIQFDFSSNPTRLAALNELITVPLCNLAALHHHDRLVGMIAVWRADGTALSAAELHILQALKPSLVGAVMRGLQAIALRQRLDEVEQKAEIFRQIDKELSDIIEMNYVFTMIMDWALRFTNADAAGLALYDSDADTLRITSHYGYRPDVTSSVERVSSSENNSIALRVARSGQAEIVPDVMLDKDYVTVADGIRTQMTVPIMRDQRVIAVMALESKKVNGFTDEHLNFVNQLTNRAGVALDNARLFEETRREREKLSHILRTITNIVIVVGGDSRVMLINEAALLAFHMTVDKRYEGKVLGEVIPHPRLRALYYDAIASEEAVSGELELPNNRIYHANITPRSGIGYIIVMQDITHYKETDRLKTELVATVSHDLKQPLSVMRGYLDLLQMVNDFDQRSVGYIDNLEYAFDNMRQLIDDLLDIARIESGLQLHIEQIDIGDVLRRCIRNNEQTAEKKSIAVALHLPQSLPEIPGDPVRLEQIFNNLISNAIKYGNVNGRVTVRVETPTAIMRIFVEDNGMGIGPEDQAQIFERFYRVRRPETDSIEGTGLGLAIVKSLIEAHNGRVDLKSELGEGTQFRVTLPLH